MSKQRVGSSRRKPPLRCWNCRNAIAPQADRLSCARCGTDYEARGGVFDLLAPGSRTGFDPYASPLGWLYDTTINSRPLGTVAAWAAWGADVPRLHAEMDAVLESQPSQVLLDVPTGGGTAFARAPGRLRGKLIGLDLSWSMLWRAAARRRQLGLEDRVVLGHADAAELPLHDSSIDRVLAFNGFHVIRAKQAVWGEFRRVLRPGGEVVGSAISTEAPAPWWLNVQATRLTRFFAPPSADELADGASRAGFRTFTLDRAGAMLYFRAS